MSGIFHAAGIAAVRLRQRRCSSQTRPAWPRSVRRWTEFLGKLPFNQRNVGETEEDQKETAKLIKELRHERIIALAEQIQLEAGRSRNTLIPTPDEVRQMLDNLDQLLTATPRSNQVAKTGQVREVIKFLTGGRIYLYQQGSRRRHVGWLQGRIQVRPLPYLVGKSIGGNETASSESGTDMVIDYRRENTQRDNEAKQAKELYDQGLLNKAIAAKLGCSRNWVTKLLKHWHRSRGLAMVDGRKRRSTLARKQVNPTMYENLADEAKALWDEGLSDLQIAAHLNCSPPTAESAVDHWHRSRGLEAPSHADRRDALLERMKDLYDQNYSFRDIAKVVGVCTRSVTQLLRERFTRDGKDLPDGRRRRRSTN